MSLHDAPDPVAAKARVPKLLSWPVVLLALLWVGLNTGPYVWRKDPVGVMGWVHHVRTLFPLVVLFGVVGWRGLGGGGRGWSLGDPLRLWVVYGVFCLLAGIVGPRPPDATYWGLSYLAVLALAYAWVGPTNALDRAVRFNWVTWAVTTAFLVVLVVLARDVLLPGGRVAATAYGVKAQVGSVAGTPMSRATGMARFAAVPGLVALFYVVRGRGWQRVLSAGVFVACGTLLYIMQARGALIGFAVGAACMLFFMGARARVGAALAVVLVGVLLLSGGSSQRTFSEFVRHVRRGQSTEQLATMTGRTRAWRAAWEEVQERPILGHGHLADRYLTGEHVHNTYFYTLLCGGVLGFVPFVVGLVWAWVLFVRAVRSRGLAARGYRDVTILVGGVLAFFTARSIPEVSGAMFAVDMLILVPALAYLGAAGHALEDDAAPGVA